MQRPKKNRAAVDSEKHTLEYTPAQFVGAIAALILFGVICFAAGLIIRGLDSAVVSTAARTETAAASVGEGKQRTPDTMAEEAQDAGRATAIPPESQTGDFRIVKRPATAKPTAERTEPSDSQTPPPSSPPAQPPSSPLAQPPVSEPEPAAETPKAPEPEPKAEPAIEFDIDEFASETEFAAATTETASSTVEQAPKGEGGSGRFTIQLVAYSVANRARAESFVADIKKSDQLDARLVMSQDGKHIRVWVGDFADRASAERRQEELRQNELFKNCIVKAI